MSYRPTVTTVRRYNFRHDHGKIAGIGLMDKYGLRAHLTTDEALQVAHDIADLLQEMKDND